MSVLTKEQIQKLTPEAQEVFASLTLAEAKRRSHLLEAARRYRGQKWIPALAPAVLVLVFTLSLRESTHSVGGLPLSYIMALIVYGVAQFQITGISRRLDALVQLLEADLSSQRTAVSHEQAEPSA